MCASRMQYIGIEPWSDQTKDYKTGTCCLWLSQARTWISNDICHSHVCVQLFELRTDISGIIDHHCFPFHFALANIFKGRWKITNIFSQSYSDPEKEIYVLFSNCLQNNIRRGILQESVNWKRIDNTDRVHELY